MIQEDARSCLIGIRPRNTCHLLCPCRYISFIPGCLCLSDLTPKYQATGLFIQLLYLISSCTSSSIFSKPEQGRT
ncbi:hypothetical protein BDZ45DRAFT_351468 [Acephala macrosclerotiorum]|nr:hypothetical protein BDZ45DRAFT_351468 [Acephala macrosclerotiorum]